MTSYVSIPNGDIDQDSPITQPLMTALRDNPIAIAEGATGAPRIYGAAMYGTTTGTTVLRNCLPSGTRGLSISTNITIEDFIDSASFTAITACSIQVLITASISVPFGGQGGLSIYKNGTVVQSYTTSQTNATLNISLAAGDSVGAYISARGTSGGLTSSTSVSTLQYRVNTRSAVMT